MQCAMSFVLFCQLSRNAALMYRHDWTHFLERTFKVAFYFLCLAGPTSERRTISP